MLMIHKSAAYDFIVGGQKGWSVPSDSNNPFNQWAEKSRFQVGDSLGKFNDIFLSNICIRTNKTVFTLSCAKYKHLNT